MSPIRPAWCIPGPSHSFSPRRVKDERRSFALVTGLAIIKEPANLIRLDKEESPRDPSLLPSIRTALNQEELSPRHQSSERCILAGPSLQQATDEIGNNGRHPPP